MRKNFLWAVFIISAALIQMTWLETIEVGGVRPDLPLLLVVYFAIADGEERAMFSGVLGGIFQDIAGNNSLGHHVLCHVLIGYAVGRLTVRLITEHPAIKIVIVFLASFVYGFLYNTIEYVQNPEVSMLHNILSQIIPGAFYTALVTPIVFLMLARTFHREGAVFQAER